MPALREGLGEGRAATVAELGEFGCACGNLEQGAARTCNGASQMVDEHPWGTKSHASAVALLPASVGYLLGDDGVAHGHDLVDHLPVQALAVGRQLALAGRLAPSDGLVALALLPGGSSLAAFLHAATLVVVAVLVAMTALAYSTDWSDGGTAMQ